MHCAYVFYFMRLDRRGQSSSLQLQWTDHRKLLRMLQEFETYTNTYEADLANSRREQSHLVTGGDTDVSYISKAYIERLVAS